jgi:hypothetical protein
VAACGDDAEEQPATETTPAEPTTTETATAESSALCDDVDALRDSTAELQDTEIERGALSVLTDELRAIQADVTRVAEDAAAEYSSEVETLRTRATALGSSIEAAAADPSAATVTQVRDDVSALGSAVTALGDAVADTC